MVVKCMTKRFEGGGGGGEASGSDILSTPPPHMNSFRLHPTPVSACFGKYFLMTPLPHFKSF